MHRLPGTAVAAAILLTGCAASPPVSELRDNVGRVDFVQIGEEPLVYSLGVVDATSFWAEYGDDVSANLGGSIVFSGVHADASAAERKRQPTEADVMRALVDGYPMTANLTQALLPKVAGKWGVRYEPSALQLGEDMTPAIADGYLHGYTGDADMVLASYLWRFELTERPTVGGALAAGFTLGTNTKKVTASLAWHTAAYQREADGRYKEVWRHVCWVPPAKNNISVPFPELMDNPERGHDIWADADRVAREFCGKQVAALD